VRGVHAVAWHDPDPATVDMERGVVRYSFFTTDNAARVGSPDRYLVVQVIERDRRRVEVVTSSVNRPFAFSARARARSLATMAGRAKPCPPPFDF